MPLHPLVLVADDDRDTRELLQRALVRRGFSVEVVSDGFELLQRVHETPTPAAVVTDLDMPRVSGLDALPQLVSRGIPVIVVSALHPRLNEAALHRRGAAAVLQKPLRSRDLSDQLRRVLKLDPPNSSSPPAC